MSVTSTPLTPELTDYLRSSFSTEDDFLRDLNSQAAASGIPDIHIASEQTACLQLLLRSINARTVVEVGSLAGYSTIILARALPPDGIVVACEKDPRHAAFIREKAAEAGLGSVIDVLQGAALDTLPSHALLTQSEPSIDVVFIDADKPNYQNYYDLLVPHVRVGGFVIGDNALAWGQVHMADPENEPKNVRAIRAFNDRMSSDPRFLTTLIPLGDGMVVGLKVSA